MISFTLKNYPSSFMLGKLTFPAQSVAFNSDETHTLPFKLRQFVAQTIREHAHARRIEQNV